MCRLPVGRSVVVLTVTGIREEIPDSDWIRITPNPNDCSCHHAYLFQKFHENPFTSDAAPSCAVR